MAERLQAAEEIEVRTSRARPRLYKALATMGVAAAFGSVSPALSAAPANAASKHVATAHKHKTPPRTIETPIQKATTSTVQRFAAQIIADYNQVKGNPQYQGVGYVPEHAPPGPGQEDFNVEYPTGTDIITEGDGTTKNIGTGGYRLYATISYPRNQKTPPTKINLNNVTNIGVSETTSVSVPGPVAPGYSPYSAGPSYYFSMSGNNSSSTKNQWDMSQEIDFTTGRDDWSYVVGSGNINKGGNAAPLTMQELQTEASEVQTFLNNAKQYVVTLITPALESSFPPPTNQYPPLSPMS